MVDVRITGANQLHELSKRLKAADKTLPAKLRKAIRQGTAPAVSATKQAITTLPVKGSRGGGRKQRSTHTGDAAVGRLKARAAKTQMGEADLAAREGKARDRAQRRAGLRQSIAAAIKVEIKTGSRAAVRIKVDEKKLPPDQQTLPRRLDDPRGWRHPVFGDREVWVRQQGGPWFESTIRRHLDATRKAVLAAMDEVARELDK